MWMCVMKSEERSLLKKCFEIFEGPRFHPYVCDRGRTKKVWLSGNLLGVQAQSPSRGMSRPLTNVRGVSCPAHGSCTSQIHVNPSVKSLAYGSNATVVNLGSPECPVLEFALPAGRPGPVTVDIGNVVTVEHDQGANVLNVGNVQHAVLDFYLPKGSTPAVTIGNVTTLPYGSNAAVTTSGNATNVVLNFGIPASNETFETISRNIRSMPAAIAYSNTGDIANITYTSNVHGTVIKSFGYDPSGRLTSLTLSGNAAAGLPTTKTFAYDADDNLVSTSYS